MRISGLASGMDTETMIKELMTAERLPLQKIEQKKQYMEWQRDDYREVNKKLFDFRNLASDTMLRQSTFIQKTTTTSSPDEVSVKNINSISNFSGTITVQQLAEKATMRTKSRVNGSPTPIDVNAKLSSFNLTGTQSISIRAIKEDGTLQTAEEAFTYSFDPTEKSLQNVLDEINNNSNITAFYDSFTGKISVTAKNSGNNASGNEIEITMSSAFQTFTDLESTNVAAAWNGSGTEGKNAKFTLDGLATERSSNTFTINGFEVTIKQATNTRISFSSSTDTDKVLESVVKFVDEYNKLIQELNDKIDEKKYRDYQPLSNDEKEAMTEKQIELWEEKAKSGTLRNDSILSGALSKLRLELNSTVEALTGVNRLSDIGITPSKNYLDNGKLILDESKLREAISNDPNGVYELFAADSTNKAEKGLGRRLVSILEDTRSLVIEKAGSDSSVNNSHTLGRLLDNYDNQIDRFEERLIQVEDRYWRQFTAMEKAIQQANQQSMYLMNAFGGQ
ncbi:flagellar hook-associated protein 2 [Ureibacillus sp. MALMAid1270]|uniref:flagellar hook-associated protein 2 n=1 Tax=Ureibacillus sp. MALMAid1270 TaxID=3411629 RepID=UPI003BA5DF74